MGHDLRRSHDVFLSYSSNDKTWADAACAVLERRGIRCWIAPRDITPGEEWGAEIIRGINGSRVMVLIFSAHANASGQVRREVERAISGGLAVLPIRVEDVRPEGAMEFALGNTHWLDAFAPPVEKQLERLARSVKTLLANDSASHPGGPAFEPTAGGDFEPLGPEPGPRYFLLGAVGLAVMATLVVVAAWFLMSRAGARDTTPATSTIAESPARTDQERIQGRWEVVDQGNFATKKKGGVGGLVWVFSGSELKIYRTAEHQDAGDFDLRGAFALSTGVERKLFDVTVAPKDPEDKPLEFLGIYEFEGEFLKICISFRRDNDPNARRPDSFVPGGSPPRVYRKFHRTGGGRRG